MGEVEREDGPDQPVPGQDEPQPADAPEAEPPDDGEAEPPPTLLRELAKLSPAGEVGPAAGEQALDDEEKERRDGPRIRTSTKVVVVAAAWLLFTLFLVGRFSSGGPREENPTRLDQAAAGDEEGAVAEGDEAPEEAEAGDASHGEAPDLDHADGAAVYSDDAGAGAAAVSGGAGAGGVYAGAPAEGSAGVGSGGAVPGAAPGAPGTATAPGAAGGAATSTPPSGGGTTSTTAASPGGGGGPTTTTAAGGSAGAPVDRTITISGKGHFAYDPPSLTVPSGSRVRMANDSNADHTWQIGNEAPTPVPKNGPPTAYRTFTSTVTFSCSIHKNMSGTITVT